MALVMAAMLVATACGRSDDGSATDTTPIAVSASGRQSDTPAGVTVAPATTGTTAPTGGSVTSDTVASSTPTASTGADTSGETTATIPSPTSTPTTPPPTSTEADDGDRPITIRLRLDRRVDDGATEGFERFAESVLTDERGWVRAGFAFTFDDADFDYTVVLAEGSEVDQLCLPYDTFGRFSCQIGPVVALNADRWRGAVDSWPASLDAYRAMLVNHEVGHLLGQHHPASRCPGDGQPAPVMAQQSSGVAPCTANPWPLAWEIDCAERGLEPLAPPFERNITLTCGPDGPVG